MSEIVLFLFATAGLIWIVTRSKLLKPFRESLSRAAGKNGIMLFFSKMINCLGCFGFWAALMVHALQYFGVSMAIYALCGAAIGRIFAHFIKTE